MIRGLQFKVNINVERKRKPKNSSMKTINSSTDEKESFIYIDYLFIDPYPRSIKIIP